MVKRTRVLVTYGFTARDLGRDVETKLVSDDVITYKARRSSAGHLLWNNLVSISASVRWSDPTETRPRI